MPSNNLLSLLQILQFVAVSLLLVWPMPARAQTVVATVPVGAARAVAVNPVSNKIYVAGFGNVIVIDDVTNSTTTVAGSSSAVAVAVNSATNKIYLANASGHADPNKSGLHAVSPLAACAAERPIEKTRQV